MIHKMKLNESPFERMKNGTKTVEFRLFDENEEIHIKEDENSGGKCVQINEILRVTSEHWVRDRVYAKIIDKMKKDGII